MERRTFLRSLLGVAAATALPSEVWPFRKIFLPAAPKIITGRWDMVDEEVWGLTRAEYPGRLPPEVLDLYAPPRTFKVFGPHGAAIGSGSMTVLKVDQRHKVILFG